MKIKVVFHFVSFQQMQPRISIWWCHEGQEWGNFIRGLGWWHLFWVSVCLNQHIFTRIQNVLKDHKNGHLELKSTTFTVNRYYYYCITVFHVMKKTLHASIQIAESLNNISSSDLPKNWWGGMKASLRELFSEC